MMKIVCLLFATFALATACFAQALPEVCPKHIEAPIYPAIARTAHIQGKVVVQETIDADGTVSNPEVKNLDSVPSLLFRSTLANASTWVFAKPPTAPYTLTITYEYRFDKSLPVDYAGDKEITKVVFDFPNHVEILANERVLVESDKSKQSVQRKRD